MSLAAVQAAIDAGRRAAAIATGQTYDVYRIGPGSNGQIVTAANKIFSGFYCSMMRVKSLADTEVNWFSTVPIFRGICDGAKLKVGDVFVETGLRADTSGMFTLTYLRPLRQYIFAQTPIAASITRSISNPTAITSGIAPYASMNKATEQTLVLINGLYSFKPAGLYTPAMVPLGLQATSRQGEQPPPDVRLPTDVPRQRWDVFLANTPGTILFESDLINAANGDRYYTSVAALQTIGLQGWQILALKVRV